MIPKISVTSKPLVSVVMSAYNTGKYIRDAIYSILNQTYRNIEFIIVNDGSTDDTADIVHSFNDTRIVFIDNKDNKGIPVAQNEGCRLAKGKYIAIMDSDDFSFPDRIKIQTAAMEKDNDLLMVSCMYILNNRLCLRATDYRIIKESLKSGNCFGGGMVMFRTDIFWEIGGFDEDNKWAADYDLNCRMALKGKITILPEVLYYYRLNQESTTVIRRCEQAMDGFKARNKYLNALNSFSNSNFVKKNVSNP
jgi:glycosyltransferase involved in cell wall biosynthesis